MVKIILLDSNSLINRAFYAIPPMTTRDGVFTNAVYGYLSMLARLIAEHNPTHIGAVFDLKGPPSATEFMISTRLPESPCQWSLFRRWISLKSFLPR